MNTNDASPAGGISWPIGLKIFGISASLLLLMVSVTFITTQNLEQLNEHLDLLTNHILPTDQAISAIQLSQNTQRLLFDRMVKLGTSIKFPLAKEEAQALVQKIGGCDFEQISQATREIRQKYQNDNDRELLRFMVNGICVDTRIANLQNALERILNSPYIKENQSYAQKISQLDEKAKHLVKFRINLYASLAKHFDEYEESDDKVKELSLSKISDHRRLVNQSIREISESLHKFTLETAKASSEMEHKAFRLSWFVTMAALMVGVFYTALLTRSLVKPVRQLVTGVKQIQSGNLNTQLQITSKDEIGVLTKSFNHMADELKEKEFIKNTFGQYVDPRIVRDILNNHTESLNGENREMTIQFSDIEGFTKICEHLTPSATVKFLNHFFSFMSQSVLGHKGIIDKYIGDSVMAFWGPPFCLEAENAALACLAALEQVSRLSQFNDTLPSILGLRRGLPRVNIRLGLCTGFVTLGSIGSEATRSYTVIGETVNLASRMEQACKMYGTRIIISEETAKKTAGIMEARELDLIVPAGMRETKVNIYELLGECGKVPDNMLKMRDHFQQGLARYRARDWEAALSLFKICLELVPGDKPSLLFLERVAHFQQLPPDDAWNGEWKQTKVSTVKTADDTDGNPA